MARPERDYDEGYDDGYADGLRAGRRAHRILSGTRTTRSDKRRTARRTRSSSSPRKSPRKLTAHNRFMKTEMRSLRRKHPRMKQTQIMKKANVAWRKKKRGKK
jgi:hypothetical protein